MRSQKLFIYLLWILNALFIIYYLILNYYNRLSQDDYGFLTWAASNNMYDAVKGMYLTHQGRFVTFAFHWLKYRLIGMTSSFFFEPIINYMIGVSALYLMTVKIIKENRLAISLLFMNILVIINFEFSAFYWICASGGIRNFAIVVFLAYFIIYEKRQIISYLGLILLSVYIGGSSEAFSPLVLFLMFAYGFYVLCQNRFSVKETLSNKKIQRLCTSAVVIAIGAYFVITAPGNANRLAHYEQPSIFNAFIISLKNTTIFFYLLFFKVHYILLGCFVSFLFGASLSKIQVDYSKNIFWYSTFVLTVFIWINTIPAAWAMGGFGFHRIYTTAIEVVFIYSVFWSFILGQQISNKLRFPLYQVSYLVLLMFCGVEVVNIVVDTPTARKYNESDKKRIALILEEKQKGRKEPLYLPPLYKPETFNLKSVVLSVVFDNDKYPVLFYSNEIDSAIKEDNAETGFNNKCLMSYFDLPFVIYRKDK